MAKKPNYDFERRRKEQDRKKKKDAKREERLLRKRDADGNELPEDGAENADGPPVAEEQGDGQPG